MAFNADYFSSFDFENPLKRAQLLMQFDHALATKDVKEIKMYLAFMLQTIATKKKLIQERKPGGDKMAELKSLQSFKGLVCSTSYTSHKVIITSYHFNNIP